MEKARWQRNRYWLAVSWFLMLAAGGLACGQPEGEGARQPHVRVQVYNYAQASDQSLEQGEKEAARIFREIGMQISWGNCNPSTMDIHLVADCAPPAGPLELGLRILPSLAAVRGVTDSHTMGLSFGNLASVSWRWVTDEAEVLHIAASDILGPAIAHELGHLLLRQPGHSRIGIMRARWSRNDFERAPLGTFSFTSEQAESIRDEVGKRDQEQTAADIGKAAVSP